MAENAPFWPSSQYPGGRVRCAAPAQIAEIGRELRQRQHGEEVVRAVLGGNFRRLAGEVWK